MRPDGVLTGLRWLLGTGLAAGAWACASGWEPAFDEAAPAGLFEHVAIADAETALTFARVERDGARRVIAVTAYRDGVVRGVDLSSALGRPVDDPLTLFNDLGYDGVRDAVRAAPAAATISVPASALTLPIDLGAHHVAAATNFPEHAGDAGVEDGPFLFAKLVQPTGARDPVPAGAALLDYEVEIAWVTLTPLTEGAEPEFLGLVLGNDFTDRDTLLRSLDPWDVASGAGFATGKSFPGFLPIGDLFVIPRDHRRFAADLELRLYVNGALRQRAMANEMVWDFDEILRRTWAWKDRRWSHRGDYVTLLGGDCDVLAERTLILSGTPHGTIFAGLRARHYAGGLTSWLLGGWSTPIPSHVVAAYIADARASGAYLHPGDRVEIQVDRLGVIRNEVVQRSTGSDQRKWLNS